jgi:hypothetical protein
MQDASPEELIAICRYLLSGELIHADTDEYSQEHFNNLDIESTFDTLTYLSEQLAASDSLQLRGEIWRKAFDIWEGDVVRIYAQEDRVPPSLGIAAAAAEVNEFFVGIVEPERGHRHYELLNEIWLQAEGLRERVESLTYAHAHHHDHEQQIATIRGQALQLHDEYLAVQDEHREE